MTTAFATSPDGLSIAYEAHGRGLPALVFVHGWSCDRGCWHAQLAALSNRHRVVAVDLAGHGRSAADRRDWSIEAFAGDVAAVVSALGLDRVVLVGHSMGADVVLRAWRLLDDRVRGLVCVDQYTALDRWMDEAAVAQRVAPFEADFVDTTRAFVRRLFGASADPALVERIGAKMASAPKRIAVAALTATWNHGREVCGLLSEITVPVIALNADRVATDVESMRRHGLEVVVMADVGHFPMLERPEAFNRCLADVVGRLGHEVRAGAGR